MQQLARDLKISEHVYFLGFRRDIPDVLPEFDVLMFTSNNEPTGGILLEAYACKVPVVAARAGGIPEVVVDGKTGVLVEVGNAEAFAKATLELLDDDVRQSELTTNGFNHLMRNFTKDVIAKKMFNELSSVLKQ
jgi:glycosyltransferase involved in cell wall biosynthesis